MKGDETRHEINEKRRKGKGGKSRVRWEARRRGKKEKVAKINGKEEKQGDRGREATGRASGKGEDMEKG